MGKEKSQHRQHQLLQLSRRIVTLPGAQARNMTSRCVPVSATISSEVEARLSLPVQLANLPEPGRTFIGKTRSLCSQMCPTVAAPFPTSAQSCCLIILLKSHPQLASGSQMCSRLSLSCIFCGAGATGCVTGCLALGLTPPSISLLVSPTLVQGAHWPVLLSGRLGPWTAASHFLNSPLHVHRGQGALLSKDHSFE